MSSVMPGNMAMKSPMFIVMARNRKVVSPVTSTHAANAMASSTLS